eukprot:CAMPEP_0119334756 /NCGR_PEP_ID=MMETSP1333-20130426/88023_1 /TAXON_ID=418940 /ORGANISM="Scyphosphaera apsteinii, Strain RCC1455" /LENGTH=109 /DNA_ID=CAMNT_0007345133 /DNA_START=248 /DNA_END=574 /DNA_ORIENTATION=-
MTFMSPTTGVRSHYRTKTADDCNDVDGQAAGRAAEQIACLRAMQLHTSSPLRHVPASSEASLSTTSALPPCSTECSEGERIRISYAPNAAHVHPLEALQELELPHNIPK